MVKNVNKEHRENLSGTEKVAKAITGFVGTFACFVIFALLASISLPSVIASGNVITWISWITQSFLQLVLLPLIMISQNIDSKHAELTAESDYQTDFKSEAFLEEINRKLDILLYIN